MINEAEKRVEEVLQADKIIYAKMIEIEREVNSFKQEVRRFSVKPQLIVDEYHKIKQRLQAEKQGQGFGGVEQNGPQM